MWVEGMRRRRRWLVAALASLTVLAGVGLVRSSGQETPLREGLLAKLDCNPANFPDCGWGAWGNQPGRAPDYKSQLLEGQGPQGQDAVEFSQLPGQPRQYYLGWGTKERGPEPDGVVRYVRARVWVPGPAGKRRGYHGDWSAKFLILGDGGDELGRVICNLRDDGTDPDTMSIECGRNIDGGDHSTGLQPLTLGTWHSIQVEARSGPNASIALWVDNNDYKRPTSRTTGRFTLVTTQWKFLGVGFYAGSNGTQRGGENLVVLRIADDVELGSAFDPTWHR